MLELNESLLQDLPEKINLSQSNLLYSLDLHLKKKKDGEDFCFYGSGTVRVGPKKGKIALESKFNLKKNNWISGSYIVDGLGVDDKFSVEGGKIHFKNGDSKKVIQNNSPFFEPLSILFVVIHFYRTKKEEFVIQLLAGSKLRNITFRNNMAFIKEKKWGEIQGEKDKILIVISRIRAKIKVLLP